jgi:hypothetical protein
MMPLMSDAEPLSNWVIKPIFLVGAERSGTTLLRLMLDHHPLIAFCHEFEYAVDGLHQAEWPSLDRYYERLWCDRIFRSAEFEIDPSLNYPELVNSFLVQKRDRDRKIIVGATVHHYFDRTLRIWPDARFIHLVRDGRDVATSTIGMGWAGNVYMGVRQWIEAETLWNQFRQQLNPQCYIQIQYEQLIYEPTSTLTQLCHWIGVVYNAAMLSYPQFTSYASPNPALVGQWHHKLSPSEIQQVEVQAATLLVERGYTLSGLPICPISIWQHWSLHLQSWWGQLQFRVRRYGWPLVLMNYIARHLSLQWLARKTQGQIDEICKAYLQ